MGRPTRRSPPGSTKISLDGEEDIQTGQDLNGHRSCESRKGAEGARHEDPGRDSRCRLRRSAQARCAQAPDGSHPPRRWYRPLAGGSPPIARPADPPCISLTQARGTAAVESPTAGSPCLKPMRSPSARPFGSSSFSRHADRPTIARSPQTSHRSDIYRLTTVANAPSRAFMRPSRSGASIEARHRSTS